jgi:carbon monoxide dehydrogenase subunit G
VQLSDKFEINAPLDKLWESLLNPVELLTCIPGAEEITKVAENSYKGIIKDKVGPFVVKMKVEADYTDIVPKQHFVIRSKGADILEAGTFTSECCLDLEEISTSKVSISYSLNVTIVGQLATIGKRIIMAKVNSSAEQFAENINNRFSDKGIDLPRKSEGLFSAIIRYIKKVVTT